MHQVWEDQATTSIGPQPLAPHSPLPASSQPVMLTNPFPHQGYITASHAQGHAAPPPS